MGEQAIVLKSLQTHQVLHSKIIQILSTEKKFDKISLLEHEGQSFPFKFGRRKLFFYYKRKCGSEQKWQEIWKKSHPYWYVIPSAAEINTICTKMAAVFLIFLAPPRSNRAK